MIRLIVSLVAAAVTILGNPAYAQSALKGTAPSVFRGTPSERFVTPLSSEPADACRNGFVSLRDEAERRGRLVKAASDRRAAREEACQVLGSFREAELKMIRYVDANSARCGLQHVAVRLKAGAAKTEEMYRRLCAVPGV